MRKIDIAEIDICQDIETFHKMAHNAMPDITQQDLEIINENMKNFEEVEMTGRQSVVAIITIIHHFILQANESEIAKGRRTQ